MNAHVLLKAPVPPRAPLLQVRGLRVEIPTVQGLLRPVRGVDLDVRQGEIHAIVGESGCGKTITSLSLLGLQPSAAVCRADRLTIGEQSLIGLSRAEWRRIRGRRMAMVFQDPMTSLDPCYRIGDQMVEILRQHERVTSAAARDRACALLEKVGIPAPRDRFHQYPHQLSGGLRQRVMIAMALLCEPELIIADEPTTALDVTVQMRILELLVSIRDESGVGILLITHDLGVVAKVADTISVMYGGEIVETGPTDAVLANPHHPYTEGLLRSTPVPGLTQRGRPLGFIPGIVPRQSGELTRCGFIDRCPYREARCEAPISLRPEPVHRQVRCVLSAEDQRDPAAWVRAVEEA